MQQVSWLQMVGGWPAEYSSASSRAGGLHSALHDPGPLSTGSAGVAGGSLCSLPTTPSTKASSLAADLDMASRTPTPMPGRNEPVFCLLHAGYRADLEPSKPNMLSLDLHETR